MIIYKNNYITVFLDKRPINPGHILIAPNEHYLDLDEIPDQVLRNIITTSKKMLTCLKEIYKIDGYTLLQNGGSFKNIEHFHMHLFPRYLDDEFAFVFSDEYKEVDLNYVEKIKNALNKKEEYFYSSTMYLFNLLFSILPIPMNLF